MTVLTFTLIMLLGAFLAGFVGFARAEHEGAVAQVHGFDDTG